MLDRLVRLGIKGGAWLGGGLLLWLLGTIVLQSLPALQGYGGSVLSSQVWLPDQGKFGGLAFIFGTLLSSSLSLLVALPMGLAVGILTSRSLPLVPSLLRTAMQLLMAVMSSIPSVIIGLWGITTLVPIFGASMLSAVVVLVIMLIPTIAEVYRSAYDSFPVQWRNNSLALGLDPWHTLWQLYLPSNLSAMLSAGVLALGRAVGETMAVTMVIGNPTRPAINWSLLSPSATIPSILANQFGEAMEPIHISALMFLAMILFSISLVANLGVELIRYWGKSQGYSHTF